MERKLNAATKRWLRSVGFTKALISGSLGGEVGQETVCTQGSYTKLNSINTHMAEIHGYVKKLNSTAERMADDISAIRRTTQDMAHDVHQTAISSFITAQCSIITAQNTAAIKYLSAN